MIPHVTELKSVVAYLVFTLPVNGSIATNDEVASAALVHLSLIGGLVAITVGIMFMNIAIEMSLRIIVLDGIDGDSGIKIVVVAVSEDGKLKYFCSDECCSLNFEFCVVYRIATKYAKKNCMP